MSYMRNYIRDREVEENSLEKESQEPKKKNMYMRNYLTNNLPEMELPEETNIPEKQEKPKKLVSGYGSVPTEEEEANKIPFEGENDLEREIERHRARSTSKVIATVGGAAGDLLHFATSLIGSEDVLPTSETIEYLFSQAPGGRYLDPKNELEKKGDEFVRSVAAFAIPGSKVYSFARNLGIPIVGMAVKEGLMQKGVNEGPATWVKVGTEAILDVINGRSKLGGGALNYLKSLYNKSESLLPKGAIVDAVHYVRDLKSLKQKFLSGGKSPQKEAALKRIDELLKKVDMPDENARKKVLAQLEADPAYRLSKNKKKIRDEALSKIKSRPTVKVQELVDARKTTNEIIDAQSGFAFGTKASVAKKSADRLKEVNSKVIDAVNEYGVSNPKFGAANAIANEGYAAYAASNKMTEFLEKNFGDRVHSKALKTILGLGGSGAVAIGSTIAPLAAAAGAAITPLYYGLKIAYRVAKSPTLKKYYTDIMKNSLIGNSLEVGKSIQKMDKVFLDEEKESEQRKSELKRRNKTRNPEKNKKSS